MRVIDARELEPGHGFKPVDVCIVGAGAAGIYVAHRLALEGARVLVLEAGGEVCTGDAELGMGVQLGGSAYRGTTLGRAFGLGGTTARWGGQLIPHGESDVLRADADAAAAWRHIVDVVARHGHRVRRVLGLGGSATRLGAGPFQAVGERLRGLGLLLLASDWLPFQRRNLSRLLRHRYPRGGRVEVCLHAVVRAWQLESGPAGTARVASVTLRSQGHDFTVRAPELVLAAGAIESARVLLEIERSVPTSPFSSRHIGRRLGDHLSCTVARVPAIARAAVRESFGPRFEAGCLRSARLLELSPDPASARGFFHFIFELENPGYDLARKALGALQARRKPDVSAAELRRGLGGLLGLGYERVLRSRLHVPAGTPVHLQLDIEQLPAARRGITLGQELDAFGRPVAALSWDVNETDRAQVSAAVTRFARAWNAARPVLPQLLFEADPALALADAFHPAGVCRLGSDANAVVDPELRVRGMENLWLLSTGVFPSAGTANPAFSMLCLGEELAQRLTPVRDGAPRIGKRGT